MAFFGLIAINGLFAGAQFALVAVDRYEVEAAARSGSRRPRTVRRALETLSFQLSGAQLGITVSSLTLGFVVDNAIGPILTPMLSWVPGIHEGSLVAITAALALILATITQMILGELVPKNLALAKPMATAMLFVPPAVVVNAAVSPVIRSLNAIANAAIRLIRLEPKEELEGFRSVEEMREALRWADREDALEGVEYEVLDRALGLGQKTVRDVMVPRTHVAVVPTTANLSDLTRLSRETGFSRFPVKGAAASEWIGVAHVKDVLEIPIEARASTPVSAKLQQALVVPPARDLRSLLLEMQDSKHALAIVDDEFGQAVGIVTLEAIIEELLGDIEDEYDRPARVQIQKTGRDSFNVDAIVRRDHLAEITGFSMPGGRFETLGGLLLALFQRVPEIGDRIIFRGWKLEIIEMNGPRIVLVRIYTPTRRQGSK